MSDIMVGQEYELNYPDEGEDNWCRVRVVSVSDDGRAAWVKIAERIGNSFPVPRHDLRPIRSPE